MNNEDVKQNEIDIYIAQFPEDIQVKLKAIRQVIKEEAEGAKEKISYQMPAFDLYGILVYFAAFKKHIGFYPTGSGMVAFKDKITGFKCSTGTIQFPLNKEIPFDLIREIVRFRVAENITKHEMKSKKK